MPTSTSGASSRGEGDLLTGLRHGDPFHRYLRDIPAWRRGLLSAFWHGDPAQRCLRGISAWRTIPQPISKRFLSGVITGLRHGNPAQKDTRVIPAPSLRHPRAIPVPSPHHPSLASRSSTECWPIRGLFHGHRGAHWVLQSVFGTATLPTGASEPSPRGEAVIHRPFGTSTLPADALVASSRSHYELVYGIVALLGFVKFTWYEPLLIIK